MSKYTRSKFLHCLNEAVRLMSDFQPLAWEVTLSDERVAKAKDCARRMRVLVGDAQYTDNPVIHVIAWVSDDRRPHPGVLSIGDLSLVEQAWEYYDENKTSD